MAKLSVSVDVPMPPEQAWESASDLSRYKEWLSIHRVWRSKLPETIEKGTQLDSIVEVKGMPNRVSWTVVHYRPPESMTLNGDGKGGVKVKLMGKIKPSDVGSTVTFDVHLGGPALFGPIGMVVAGALKGDITIAPSFQYLETAYQDAKEGRWSRKPFLDIVIPSLTDPTLAPPGKHVMSCFVQYAPYALAEGPETWPSQREAFGDAVIRVLEEYFPGISSLILHRHILTPWDLEKEYGLTEGNIFHGELGLDQLGFMRPVPGWARWKSPIHGLWMCASGTHPGGGVMGASGGLAAREILAAGAVS